VILLGTELWGGSRKYKKKGKERASGKAGRDYNQLEKTKQKAFNESMGLTRGKIQNESDRRTHNVVRKTNQGGEDTLESGQTKREWKRP